MPLHAGTKARTLQLDELGFDAGYSVIERLDAARQTGVPTRRWNSQALARIGSSLETEVVIGIHPGRDCSRMVKRQSNLVVHGFRACDHSAGRVDGRCNGC